MSGYKSCRLSQFLVLAAFGSVLGPALPAQEWCVPPGAKPYNARQPGITHVTLAHIDRTSMSVEDPKSSYVMAADTTTLTAGEIYTIAVTHTRDSVTFPTARNNVRVWIDYDRNGVFADSELVALANYVRYGVTELTFRVPRTLRPVDRTRLRVTAKMSDEAGHSIPTPCDKPADPIGYHGEIEDYAVSIGPSVPPKQANSDPAAEALALELLSADRAYASAAAKMNVVDALGAMFASDVIMPTPAGVFAKGRAAATDAFRANPDNATSRLDWIPVRAGVSGDGRHGFTYGYMTMTKRDSTQVPLKYLAYWIKGNDGWKVAVYRRSQRPEGEVATALRPSSLPVHLMTDHADENAAAKFAEELGAAERAFSREAGRIGLGPAFRNNGAADAMNMGGPQSASFLFGPIAISKNVGGTDSTPSQLTWGPDENVIAASSGDLGVTVGYINAPDPQGGPPRKIPFFTVWKRATPGGPWQYVAE